jgi:hypothetical protein
VPARRCRNPTALVFWCRPVGRYDSCESRGQYSPQLRRRRHVIKSPQRRRAGGTRRRLGRDRGCARGAVGAHGAKPAVDGGAASRGGWAVRDGRSWGPGELVGWPRGGRGLSWPRWTFLLERRDREAGGGRASARALCRRCSGCAGGAAWRVGRHWWTEAATFMGHASITLTLDRHRHLFPGSEDAAA